MQGSFLLSRTARQAAAFHVSKIRRILSGCLRWQWDDFLSDSGLCPGSPRKNRPATLLGGVVFSFLGHGIMSPFIPFAAIVAFFVGAVLCLTPWKVGEACWSCPENPENGYSLAPKS